MRDARPGQGGAGAIAWAAPPMKKAAMMLNIEMPPAVLATSTQNDTSEMPAEAP